MDNSQNNREEVIRIKKDYKLKSNNATYQNAYQSLLNDTHTAINNIQECLSNQSNLEQRLTLIQEGDASFADDIFGLSVSGDGDSRYRAFLSLNGKDVLGVRIGNHYEMAKVAMEKSNNKAQFLCQVVLITIPPKPEAEDAITTSTSIGHLHVLTNKLISSDSSIEDLKKILIILNDYLISPAKSYEDSLREKIQRYENYFS